MSFTLSITSILCYTCFLPTNIESPRQSKRILWRTISFGSSGLFQLFRISPYPKYCNKNIIDIMALPIVIDSLVRFRVNLLWIYNIFCTWSEFDASFAASIAGGASYLARSDRQFSLSHLREELDMNIIWISTIIGIMGLLKTS